MTESILFLNSELNKMYCMCGTIDNIVKPHIENYNFRLYITDDIEKMHCIVLNDTFNCSDSKCNHYNVYFSRQLLKLFVVNSCIKYDFFTYLELYKKDIDNKLNELKKNGDEDSYLDILENVLENGIQRKGRNGYTLSTFVHHLLFDLRKGFPLLTTKKMFFKGIVEELLFFLRGDTDTSLLEKKGVNIWKGNTSKEFIDSVGLPYSQGIMGPLYGYQWRYYNSPYEIDDNNKPIKPSNGIDQLHNCIQMIKNYPESRRIIMTTFNPCQINEGVLPPCHSLIIQFYVDNNYLDMFCYNRSQDLFLGVPFNIASSSLLLMIISNITNKIPRYINITMGDCHIYSEHVEQAILQTSRIPFRFPEVKLPTNITIENIDKLSADDFTLKNYKSYDTIKAKMIK